jgi:hypothetical protein
MARTILPLMLVGTLLLTEYAQASTKVDWEAIKTSRGDRLPDFSFCGYHGSDKSLPSDTSTPLVHVSASNNDKTSEIQKALDKAAAAGGGVVELGPGTFKVSVGLTIASGTVLRGSGVETTELAVTELEVGVPLLTLGNSTNSRIKPSFISRITDDYVGIGAAQVTVMDASGFEAGQSVFVSRPATAKWIRANGMADLIRDGEKQTWIEVCDFIHPFYAYWR